MTKTENVFKIPGARYLRGAHDNWTFSPIDESSAYCYIGEGRAGTVKKALGTCDVQFAEVVCKSVNSYSYLFLAVMRASETLRNKSKLSARERLELIKYLDKALDFAEFDVPDNVDFGYSR